MATSIGALRYDLIANVGPFMDAMRGVQGRVSSVNKIIKSTEPTMRTYRRSLEQIRRQYQRGKIDVDQYRKSVALLREEYRRNARMERAAQLTEQWGKAVAVLYTAQRALRFVRTEMEKIDQVAKQGRLLGIDPNQLQAFRMMTAEMAGMTSSQTDMALQRFTRRMNEAVNGMGEARMAVRELGLDLAKLRSMDTAEQFMEVARAMRSISSEQERLRLAFKLFDSEGAKMVLTMTDNVNALADYEAQQKRLGLGMSKEEVAAVEAANDEWSKMLDTFKGLGQTIAIIAAGPLKEFAETMQLAGAANEKLADSGARMGIGDNPLVGGIWSILSARSKMADPSLWKAVFPHADETKFKRNDDDYRFSGTGVAGAKFGISTERGLYDYYTARQALNPEQRAQGDQVKLQAQMLEELKKLNAARRADITGGSISDNEGNRLQGVN